MTEIQVKMWVRGLLATAAAMATVQASMAQTSGATSSQRPGYSYAGATPFAPSSTLQLPKIPATPPITVNGTVVEDVIARVNDRIITRTEYIRAQEGLLQDAQQHNTTATDLQEAQNNLLRDMIDRQILLAKGKQLDISGDAETMRQLDAIRQQNHMADLDALEKAAKQQGISFEDFKQQIRDQAVTSQVVREEVGRRINMSPTQEQAYYNAHTADFQAPEQVHLSEILLPTPENATTDQLNAAQAKADEVEAKIKAGTSFADVAKANSGGPTASAGGDLGDFKRGVLGDVLEKATFALPVGGVTEPIRTRQGFVILKVDSHQQGGVRPLKDVEPQVQEAIYMSALQPALREYLTKQRTEEYVNVKAGFVDTGALQQNKGIQQVGFTTYTAPPVKKKVVKHQQAEQKRAAAAQAELAAAREKAAEKAAEKKAAQDAKNGVVNASKPVKAPKIKREKIRYGQAPRNSLPTAATETAQENNAPIEGQAPGVAMASTTPTTTVTNGTGTDVDANPLAPVEAPTRKTRFSARQNEAEEKHAETKLAKAEVKASIRPVKATAQENADEKQQAAPLGLSGDTTKKVKPKRQKGEAKQRLEQKGKPAEPAAPAPTVNPTAVGAPAITSAGGSDQPKTMKPGADQTTIPSTTTPPGALPTGQPIPSVTSATPGAPATTPNPK